MTEQSIIETNEKILLAFKHVLSGCRTIIDADILYNVYFCELNEKIKKIGKNMLYSAKYDKAMDMKTIKNISPEVLFCDSDIGKINGNKFYAKNSLQHKFFMRMSSYFESKPNGKFLKHLCKKVCPHCGHNAVVGEGTEYVVCGYTDVSRGYDWIGCGRDWCFCCGKKLCKIWNDNELFVLTNRLHNQACCKNKALQNRENYEELYCQCNNSNVNRHKNV